MSEEKMIRAGIDIGGTKTLIGLVSEEGAVLASKEIPSARVKKDREGFVEEVTSELERLAREQGMTISDLAHIGVGIPGTADSREGKVLYSCNLFGDKPVSLGAMMEKRLGRPVTIVQDSWAAAWAEHLFGAGRGHSGLLCVTVGTGIGCGVILNNQVFAGPMLAAGELGHTPIEWNGRPCACGRRGCLEAYASGTAIRARALELFPEKLPKDARSEDVFALAKGGDPDAQALIQDCADRLAYGISLALGLFSVDTVLISGGISVHRTWMIDPLKEKAVAYGYPSWASLREISILPAGLGPEAPMVGAAFLTAEDMIF